MIKNALIFLAGLGIGVGSSYIFLKKKYDTKLNEELQKIREDYGFVEEDFDEIPVDDDFDESKYTELTSPEQRKEDRYIANDIALINKYAKEPKDEGPVEKDDIYSITPDEYIELNGYSKEELTYYEGDETLADDEMDCLDIRATIGDNLKYMGQYEDDVLYIRNDKLGVDYEITLDPRDYSIVAGPTEEE